MKWLIVALHAVLSQSSPEGTHVSCRYGTEASSIRSCPTWTQFLKQPRGMCPSTGAVALYSPTQQSCLSKPSPVTAVAVDTPQKRSLPAHSARKRPLNMCSPAEYVLTPMCEVRPRRPRRQAMCGFWQPLWKCDAYDAATTTRIWDKLGDLVAARLFEKTSSDSIRSCTEAYAANATVCEEHPVAWTADTDAKVFTYPRQKPRRHSMEETKHRYLLGEPFDPALFKDKIDFAAAGGARVSNHSKDVKHAKALLMTDDSEYMLVPCNGKPWFVISLGHDVNLEQVGLVSKEFFASSFRYLQILGSNTYPADKWRLIGEIETHESVTHEIFDIKPTCSRQKLGCWVKFVKVRMLGHHPIDDYYFCTVTQFQVFGSTVMEGISELYPDEDDTMDQNLRSPTINDMITGMESLVKGALNNPLLEAENYMDPLKAVALDIVNGTNGAPKVNDTSLDTIAARGKKETDTTETTTNPSKTDNGKTEPHEKNGFTDDDFGKLPLDKWRPEDLWDPKANAKWAWLLPVGSNTTDPGILVRLLIQEFEARKIRLGSDWPNLSWDDQGPTKPSSGVPPLVRLGDHLRSLETQHLQLVNATLKMRWLIGRQEGAMQILSNVALPLYETVVQLVQKVERMSRLAARTDTCVKADATPGFCPVCTPQQHWSNQCPNITREAETVGELCDSEPYRFWHWPGSKSDGHTHSTDQSSTTPDPAATNHTRRPSSCTPSPKCDRDEWFTWERLLLLTLFLSQVAQWVQLQRARTAISELVRWLSSKKKLRHSRESPEESHPVSDSDDGCSVLLMAELTLPRRRRSTSHEEKSVRNRRSTRSAAKDSGASVPSSPSSHPALADACPVDCTSFISQQMPPTPSAQGLATSHTLTGATGRLLRREFELHTHTKRNQYNRHVKNDTTTFREVEKG